MGAICFSKVFKKAFNSTLILQIESDVKHEFVKCFGGHLDHLNVACKLLTSARRVSPASRRAASRAHVAVRPRPWHIVQTVFIKGFNPTFIFQIKSDVKHEFVKSFCSHLDHLNVACKPLSSAGRVCPASRRAASRVHVAVRPRQWPIAWHGTATALCCCAGKNGLANIVTLGKPVLRIHIRAEANMKCQVKREELVPLRRIKSESYAKQCVKASRYDKEQFCSHLEASWCIANVGGHATFESERWRGTII
ncbi:hypothetical protein HW555_009862 [Spodoptera exigua]|uniref:Uncharacterized protein n=1 Tax=Spodoptera exigua TaxID=7107 RepID=A0A835L342_SPOEX|nr:hypothetical protein HW555_009862 [Spodoptera exigua]